MNNKSSNLTLQGKKVLYNQRNGYLSILKYSAKQSAEKVDAAFCIVLRNFLMYKDDILEICESNKEQGENITYDNSFCLENAYYYVEEFLGKNFAELSIENKKYAERFLELFSKSQVCGPTYALELVIGNISLGNREEECKIAAKRLAAAVYSLKTPWGHFSTANSACLALMLKNGDVPGFSEEEGVKKAAMVLFRNRVMGVSDRSILSELDVDLKSLLNNDLHSYCQKHYDMDYEVFNKAKRISLEEFLQDISNVKDIMSEAARDVCASILSKEERTQKTLVETTIEYFSNPANYPDLSDIDLDTMVDNYMSKETKQETSSENSLYKSLQNAFEDMAYRIHFKANDKYNCEQFGIYYIGFSDMRSRNYYIRERKAEKYDDDSDPIIAKYNSIKELLDDGWYPD